MDSLPFPLRAGPVPLPRPRWPAVDRVLQQVPPSLNPYTDAFTKKLGPTGSCSGSSPQEGQQLQPRREQSRFLRRAVHWQAPGRTVDAFIRPTSGSPKSACWTPLRSWSRPTGTGLLRRVAGPAPDRKALRSSLADQRDPGEETLPERRRQREALSFAPSTARSCRQTRPHTATQADQRLRQDELARSLGVTRQTLSGYERGLRRCRKTRPSSSGHLAASTRR